jgi:hypothetical protein
VLNDEQWTMNNEQRWKRFLFDLGVINFLNGWFLREGFVFQVHGLKFKVHRN